MEDAKTWIVKIILPSLVAISIKLAIQSKNKTVTLFNVISSFITGIGSAYLFSDLVISKLSHEYVPLAIAVLTISGEKIGFWFIYKFNVQGVLQGYLDRLKK